MNYENLELNHRHWPIRAAKPAELAVFKQAAEAYPGAELLPHIREAMFQRYPVVDDDELIVIRKSQLPPAAWHGICEYVPHGTPLQLAQDDQEQLMVIERSILEMIAAALMQLISLILAALGLGGGEGVPGGKKAGATAVKPQPGRSRHLLIEHDGPGF